MGLQYARKAAQLLHQVINHACSAGLGLSCYSGDHQDAHLRGLSFFRHEKIMIRKRAEKPAQQSIGLDWAKRRDWSWEYGQLVNGAVAAYYFPSGIANKAANLWDPLTPIEGLIVLLVRVAHSRI